MRPTTAAFLLLLALPILGAPRTLTIGGDPKSYAGFRIDDTVDTVEGTTSKIGGSISVDPDDLAASTVSMTVDLGSLDTGIGLRDSEMRSTLETSRFPAATFRSTGVTGPAKLTGHTPADLRIAGDFTLHGVTRRLVVPVRVVMGAPDALQATAKFTIRMTDFDITVPDKLIVSVANEVEVRFALTARAR